MEKKVTVFMPVYNTGKYLKKSIDSILNQTFKNFELLIIDDGSTDDSVEIIEKYKDSRIKLIKNNTNKGLPYTRNLGLTLANGQYLAIIDSDDIANEKRLQEQVSYLDLNKDIDIVSSNEVVIYKNIPFKKINRFSDSDVLKFLLIFENCIGNTTTMFRLKEIKDIKYRKEFFVCQDYKFWVEISKKHKFGSINKTLMTYRTGHSNITKKSKNEKKNERMELIKNIRKEAMLINKIDLSDKYFEKLNMFLDTSNRNISKFKGMPEVFNEIYKLSNERNICKKVSKYVILKQVKICDDGILKKINLLKQFDNNAIELTIKDYFNLILSQIYNFFRRAVLRCRV